MFISVDLSQFDKQLDYLHMELREVDCMLVLLNKMRQENQINGSGNLNLILKQIRVMNDQRQYIQNRMKFLKETAENFNYTKHQVSSLLENAIDDIGNV